jgi:hypothetical protein
MNRSARLFDDPNLVVLRPPPSPLNPAQNLDPHRLMTLKLDLRSHASRDIPLKQDGPRRTSTSLPPRLFNLPLGWVHRELVPYYSHMGRPSIDPVLMIRMLLVGYVFAIRSERRICAEIQVNLAYAGSASSVSKTRFPITLYSAARGTSVSERAMPYAGYSRVWWR